MVFNSLAYLFFLSLTTIAYYLFPGRFRWLWLLIASFGYYLSFIPVFFLLLIGIVLVNYFLANLLAKISDKKKSRLLTLIIILNILILASCKYFNHIFPCNHLHLYTVDLFLQTEPVNKMILPLGLSYFAFTILSYQIELKRKNIQPEKHFGYFSLYLFFFPKIAQGPIERPQHLIHQLRQSHPFNYNIVVEGLKLMVWGYFKKLVIADRLALYVNAVYNNSEQHNGTTLLVATIFFAFQMYADFSGYTDIALGSAKLFGYDLTNNFKRPYFAASIKDFWNRWHITFSSWLRDYIFLPSAYFLTNKMKREKYLYISTEKWIYLIAILITFAICGIWHGVGWTFLIWGLLFGFYLAYSNWTKDLHKKIRKRLHMRKTSSNYVIYNILLTFFLVLFAWVFFRASSLNDAFLVVKKIFTESGRLYFGEWHQLVLCVFGIVFLIVVETNQEFLTKSSLPYASRFWYKEQLAYSFLIILILLIGVFDGGQFIYFQF
jgi:alginate O-acetyltransferase complex protein AlgI